MQFQLLITLWCHLNSSSKMCFTLVCLVSEPVWLKQLGSVQKSTSLCEWQSSTSGHNNQSLSNFLYGSRLPPEQVLNKSKGKL